MGLREWVIILAILFMVILAVDAWRRVRRQRHYHGSYVRSSRTTTGDRKSRSPDANDLKVSRVDGHPTESTRPAPEPRRSTRKAQAQPAGQSGRLNLRERVPVLVDSVDTQEPGETDAETSAVQYEFDLDAPRGASAKQRVESPAEADDPLLRPKPTTAAPMPDDQVTTTAEDPASGPASEVEDDPFADLYQEPTAWEREMGDPAPLSSSSVDEEDAEEWEDDVHDPALESAEARQLADDEAGDQLLSEPEEVLVITVLARDGQEFEGSMLLQIMLACGMRFGRMNIFHATDDHGRLQYSAANAFNPGTFDLDDVDQFATRGVTFFLQLPCQGNPLEAFDAMYQSATTLATHLDGDVYDESRSVMTAQTLTHYRERIRDYQRSQLVKRA